ncbi:hypothetical protein BJF84_00110 [Rhodococcus sp. CUA-806]|nr:hypothetical protein BJF84_00110 [Rhodococcus sp. CUA-806]
MEEKYMDDLRSPELLEQINPAVEAGRVKPQQIFDANAGSSDGHWRRYILNLDSPNEDLYLSELLYRSCAKGGIPAGERRGAVVGIDRNIDWSYATLVASKYVDGIVYTEVIAQIKNPNSTILVDICKQLYKAYRCTFVMDAVTLSEVKNTLKERLHYPVQFYNIQQIAQASSITSALFATQKLSHNSDEVIQKQRPHAVTVAQSDGYRLSVKESTGDIDSIKAMVLSTHWANEMNKAKLQTFSA